MLPTQQYVACYLVVRRRFRANHDGVHARLRYHIIDLGGQVQAWESSPHFLQAVGTLIANRNHARIRHFVEDSNVVHSPVATAYDRDPQGFRGRGTFLHSKRKDCGVHSAPLLDRTAGIVRNRILRSSSRDASRTYSISMRIISSNVTRQRPFTCQTPVMPGRAASRLWWPLR